MNQFNLPWLSSLLGSSGNILSPLQSQLGGISQNIPIIIAVFLLLMFLPFVMAILNPLMRIVVTLVSAVSTIVCEAIVMIASLCITVERYVTNAVTRSRRT